MEKQEIVIQKNNQKPLIEFKEVTKVYQSGEVTINAANGINFEINKGTIVTANDIEIIPNCLFNIINQLRLINGLTIIVFDAEHLMREYTSLVSVYCDNNYGEYIKKLTKSLENIQDTNGLKAMIIIFGIEKFKSNLDTTIFNNFFKQIKRFEGIRFIISDINYKFKKYAYESWYTESVITANGIYVGKGVMDQSVIKINDFGKRYRVNCDNSSAWIFRNGTGDLIKIPLTNMDGDLNEE